MDSIDGIVERPWRWSEPANEIFAALAKAQASIKGAAKDSENPHFRSRYADLASVIDACGEHLAREGIAVVQMPVNGAAGSVGVTTLLAHSSGQWIESQLYVAPTKFDVQGVGSVITYLRRYSLAAMTRTAPADDDDGEAGMGRPADQTRRPAGNGHAAPAPWPALLQRPAHDAETGEVLAGGAPRQLVKDLSKVDWLGFGRALIKCLKATESLQDIEAWARLNAQAIETMASAAPRAHHSVLGALEQRRADLMPNIPEDAAPSDDEMLGAEEASEVMAP